MAILTLAEKINPTNWVQPICLETDDARTFVGEEVEVSGWGTLSASGSQPNELRKVKVKVWTNSRCNTSYGSNAPGGITSGMICASDTRKDSCSVSDPNTPAPVRVAP